MRKGDPPSRVAPVSVGDGSDVQPFDAFHSAMRAWSNGFGTG